MSEHNQNDQPSVQPDSNSNLNEEPKEVVTEPNTSEESPKVIENEAPKEIEIVNTNSTSQEIQTATISEEDANKEVQTPSQPEADTSSATTQPLTTIVTPIPAVAPKPSEPESAKPPKPSPRTINQEELNRVVSSISAFLTKELEDERKHNQQVYYEHEKHAILQKDFLAKLVNRMKVASNTCIVLQKYITERSAIMSKFTNALEDLPKIYTLGETGTVETSLDYLDRVTKSEIDGYNQFITSSTTSISKQLSSLNNELSSYHKKISSQQHSLNKDLESHFEKVSKNFLQLEKCLKEGIETIQSKPNDGLLHDPWLERIHYSESLNSLNNVQINYNKQLESLYQAVERLDMKRTESLKGILKDYILVHKNAMLKVSKDISIASNVVEGIKSEQDFQLFVQEDGLVKSDTKKFEENLPKLENSITFSVINPRSSSVIRSGELELSGLMRWHKYTFVLTRYGFLHYFSSPDKLDPEITIPLFFTTLSLTEPTKNTFQLTYQPSGFFSSSKTFTLRASDESQMVDWLIDLKKFIKKQVV